MKHGLHIARNKFMKQHQRAVHSQVEAKARETWVWPPVWHHVYVDKGDPRSMGCSILVRTHLSFSAVWSTHYLLEMSHDLSLQEFILRDNFISSATFLSSSIKQFYEQELSTLHDPNKCSRLTRRYSEMDLHILEFYIKWTFSWERIYSTVPHLFVIYVLRNSSSLSKTIRLLESDTEHLGPSVQLSALETLPLDIATVLPSC